MSFCWVALSTAWDPLIRGGETICMVNIQVLHHNCNQVGPQKLHGLMCLRSFGLVEGQIWSDVHLFRAEQRMAVQETMNNKITLRTMNNLVATIVALKWFRRGFLNYLVRQEERAAY